MVYIFETFALVKLLKKEHGYQDVADAVKKGGFISQGTLYELLYVITRDLLDQGDSLERSIRRAEEISSSLLMNMKEIPIAMNIQRQAVQWKVQYAKLNLSHFDCLALATAFIVKKPLFSGEKGLAQVKEVKVLG